MSDDTTANGPHDPQPHDGQSHGPVPPCPGAPAPDTQPQPPAPAPYPPAGFAGQQQQPQPPAPPKKGLGTGAIIGIVAGAVVLLIILIVGIAVVIGSIIASAGGRGGGDGGDEGAGTTPSAAVTAYLTALADGDAETALGLLSQEADDDTLLTDEVLAASNALAPITAIEVVDETPGDGSGDVTVSYLLGDTPVLADYGVVDYDDDGVWEVTGGLGYLSLSKFDGLGLTVNGVALDGAAAELEVFPGSYQLATSLPNFTLAGETTVVVTDPFTSADTSAIEPVLTDEAVQQFRALVRAAVDGCLASTTLAAGCGLELPATLDDGTQLTDGTIQRSITADASTTIDAMETTLSYDNPTLAQGEFIGAIEVTAECAQSGSSGTCSLLFGPSLGQPSIDMASANPTVLWD